MSTQVASLYAEIGADLTKLNKGLSDAQGKIKQAGGGIKSVMGTALGVFTGGMMTAAVGGLAKLGQVVDKRIGKRNHVLDGFARREGILGVVQPRVVHAPCEIKE